MCRNTRLILYCLGLLLFILPGCAHTSSLERLSLPTPWGPIVLDFGKESARGVQSIQALRLPPPAGSTNHNTPTEYSTFTDLGFALWVPPGYLHARGEHFALRPEYSKTLKQHITESIKNEKTKFGYAAVDTIATHALLTSPAIRYTHGDSVTAKFAVGSVLNGWPITDAAMQEMTRTGETTIVLPRRQIMITSVRKQDLFPKVFSPSPPNLLLWSSRRLDMAFNVDSIYGDAERGVLYARYRWSFNNVELDGHPSREVVVEGLRAYFEGEKFLYLVDLFALQGYTRSSDWDLLQQALQSFRFVKMGPGGE